MGSWISLKEGLQPGMATGGEVHGRCPDHVSSEDLESLKCQPCLEDGNLREAVGMCLECQDYLCSKCFEVHTVPKPCRNHQLLDKKQMTKSQIRTSPKDMCTERCLFHEDEVIKYYCKTHSQLSCTVCVTLDHTTCKGVQFIPHEANELSGNEEYAQIESQTKAALEIFKKAFENVEQNTKEVRSSCKNALEQIKEYRRQVETSFDKIEVKLVEQAYKIESKALKELKAASDKYKSAQEALQAALSKTKTLQHAQQSCSSYTEMMKIKEKLIDLNSSLKEANVNKSYRKRQIKFYPNQATLDSLMDPTTCGVMSGSRSGTIVSAEHFQDINVKSETDTKCWITGLVVLSDGRLVLADHNNASLKTVDVQSGQDLTQSKLTSGPWDITTISKNKIALTLPNEKKVVIVTVCTNNLSYESTFNVSGACYGIDYIYDKLAVSYCNPHAVELLNMQGTVLNHISVDQKGQDIFKTPYYLTFGLDNETLYVSNYYSHNVVCVKIDGTVVATYKDSGISYPLAPVVDICGNVYVCEYRNSVHQMSKDCKKLQILITRAGGLCYPYSLCLNEEQDKLFVGMYKNGNVSVYKTERKSF